MLRTLILIHSVMYSISDTIYGTNYYQMCYLKIIKKEEGIDEKSQTCTHYSATYEKKKPEKGCPVNFENQNYTIITRQCKGPQYNATVCCGAFKELACPFSDQINDLKNDCASTLFSYINLYGKYPPGLFSSLCREGKDGLSCTETLKTQAKASTEKSAAPDKYIQSPVLMLTSALVILQFKLF
ncbi:unnamed protein product [Ilex paraguariensis]|uniref:GPI-anchored protein LLG1-like domain-containing protein n=1 Tax=Ilex paraguariensis TaxID=185542 RepID=A0ABC8TPK6_9AQUA